MEGRENRQRLPTDDLVHVNFGYTIQVARLDAATVLSLASAPPAVNSVSPAPAR